MRRRHLRRSSYYSNLRLTGFEALGRPGQDCEVDVGQCVRTFREESGLSLRALADRSGVSVNTLSLIENGKSSPGVSTLQKISFALQVPIIAFFLPNQVDQKVIYTRTGRRKQVTFEHGILEDLGAGLSGGTIEPFIVTLEPHADSGPDPILHTGYEFVFCLAGRIAYIVDNLRYILDPGDTLFFESHLPHCWQNLAPEPSKKILILCSADGLEQPIGRHLSAE